MAASLAPPIPLPRTSESDATSRFAHEFCNRWTDCGKGKEDAATVNLRKDDTSCACGSEAVPRRKPQADASKLPGAEMFSRVGFRSRGDDTHFESSRIWRSTHITCRRRVEAITTRRRWAKEGERREEGREALCAVAGIQFCREMAAPHGASGKEVCPIPSYPASSTVQSIIASVFNIRKGYRTTYSH